ncbi:nucleotidyltransferase family protein [Longimicrobium sp.]|uniref:nucleotidyltransferase family protein n=1 Tax=Longimicrobium sp. TaxID=2029185 RepID=UPI002BD9EC26|nr:nucleotidyltransferase family protein [Longimicrobium sp.]HSU15017.1 nucleotidyltransferase family protein [Longimicrobium sp.]
MDTTRITKEQVAARLREAAERIFALGARRIALFGSVARGEAGPDSDVDLLVQFDPGQKTFENFMELSFMLEELLERRVELVTTEALSPFIGPHILREAQDVLLAA